jgi:hypothetical protein
LESENQALITLPCRLLNVTAGAVQFDGLGLGDNVRSHQGFEKTPVRFTVVRAVLFQHACNVCVRGTYDFQKGDVKGKLDTYVVSKRAKLQFIAPFLCEENGVFCRGCNTSHVLISIRPTTNNKSQIFSHQKLNADHKSQQTNKLKLVDPSDVCREVSEPLDH